MRNVGHSSRARISRTAALLCLPVLLSLAGSARAIDVSNTDELRDAIETANLTPTTTTVIQFTGNITLDTALIPVAANVTFMGNGHTLDGGDSFQLLFIDSGTVRIEGLVMRDGTSQGGDGGAGRGGGGLGAGGALFVNSTAVVTLRDVQFLDNTARGGSGGVDTEATVGGGGGGFHGDGAASGGGGGYDGDGAINGGGGGGLEGDGLPGLLLIPPNGGGKEEDGEGGDGSLLPGTTGGAGGEFEGGGGGSNGGAGGRFGGGGGAARGRGGAGGDFGGGGGFSGAELAPPVPGQPPAPVVNGSGGRGGFGGGGGGSSGTPSEGGFGGGAGTVTGIGGAGSSLGGAVFVRQGGTLRWEMSSSGQVTNGNSVARAVAGSGSPEVAGSDLYLHTGTLAAFTVEGTASTTLSGSIAGEGALSKAGTGTLVLEGASSYQGGTTVTAGTLQGNTSSLQGDIDVAASAVVRFEQSSSGTFSGTLDGAGALVKAGTGIVTLSGDNSYTGTTTVEDGTLSVTTDSLPGVATTTVLTPGTLRFDQSANDSFGGSIAGDGTLDKTGSGQLTLTGSFGSWTGDTTVRDGELALGGILLPGSIGVSSGARLGGTGTAGGDVAVAGTLAPGVPGTTETLGVGGNLDLQGGSVLEIDLTATSGDSDFVSVGGSATFGSDVVVDLAPAAGDYTSALSYDLLTAGGGITGAPAGVATEFCFFTTGLSVAGNTLQLTLTPDLTGLADRCAETKNQRAVGGALGSVIDDPAVANIRDSLNILPEDEVPRALDLLSGEGHSGFETARLAAATQFLGTLSTRMRDTGRGTTDAGEPYPLSFGLPLHPGLPGLGDGRTLAETFAGARTSGISAGGWLPAAPATRGSPFSFVSLRGDSGFGGWLDGFATFAGIEGDGNSHDTDYNLYGTSGGVDYSFSESLMLGAAFGYTRSKLSVSDLATWGTGDTMQGALYAAFSTKLFYLGAVARYGWTEMETTRRVAFGDLYETADADYDGSSLSGYVEAGIAAQELATLWLQPMASFQYTYLDTDSFRESGAEGVDLDVDSENLSSMVSNLGVRVYRPFVMDEETDLVPELRARWGHEFGDLEREVAARFDDVTTGPATFVVEGAEVGRDVAILGAGWTVIGKGNSSISLGYDATLNADLVAHAITLGVLLTW